MSSILPNSLSVLRHEQVKKNSNPNPGIVEDSMQALTRSLMLVKKVDKKFPIFQQSFLIGSLLEQLCSLYETDEAKSKELYRALCEQLEKWNIISPIAYLEEFTSVQTQYRNALYNIIQSSLMTLNIDSSRLPAMLHSRGDASNILGLIAVDRDEVFNFKTSRYKREFTELGKLGKGGYGNVFRAESKIDGQEYAIKKVPLRNSLLSEQSEALLREVKVLASLRHKNIVQYHSAWVEHETEPQLPNIDNEDSLESDGVVPFSSKYRSPRTESSLDSSDEEFVALGDVSTSEFETYSNSSRRRFQSDKAVVAFRNEKPLCPTSSKFWGESSLSEASSTKESSSQKVQFKISYSESDDDLKFDKSTAVDRKGCEAASFSPPKEVIMTHGVRRDINFHRVRSYIFTRDTSSSKHSDVIKHSRNRSFGSIASRLEYQGSSANKRKVFKLAKPSEANVKLVMYMQMQLCQMSLKQWLSLRNRSISNGKTFFHESTSFHIMKQIASALHFIHSKNLIHRDVKPPNIFLNDGENPHIMLGDFGLAKNNLSAHGSFLDKKTGRLSRHDSHTSGVGTATYAAPEQLIADFYDAKVDMYSFGIVIYELWKPFSTSMERARHLNLLRSHHIPSEFTQKYLKIGKLITSLLDHDPEHRPSSSDLQKTHFFEKSKDRVIEDQLQKILQLEEEVERLKLTNKRLTELLERKPSPTPSTHSIVDHEI